MRIADLHIPGSDEEFATCWAEVESVVDLSVRLPSIPFADPGGDIAIGQYDRLLSADFIPVLAALAAEHGDDTVTLVVVDPDPSYYREHYAHYPAFRVAGGTLEANYWAGLSREPGGDPTGAIAFSANVVAVVGSTQSWAVWGERSWDLVLLHAADGNGPWLRAGVPFPNPREAIDSFMAPPGWRSTTDSEIAVFVRNLADRASRSRTQ